MSASTARRKWAERAWVAISLGYAGFRVALAKATLESHGLNIWVFAIIEFTSTIPYAIGTSRLLQALLDHERGKAIRWGLVASVGFIAPDLYALVALHDAPVYLYVIIATWTTLAAVFAVRSVVRTNRARQTAKLQLDAVPASAVPGDAGAAGPDAAR